MLGIKASIWRTLAGLCHVTVKALRSECITALLVSASYIGMRLRLARALPWSLVGEGMANNLSAVKVGPKPSNDVGGKIWELVQLGVYEKEVEDGVRLFGQARWSAAAVEDGHERRLQALSK